MTRLRAARQLGLTGLWLAAVFTVGAWLGMALTLAPARAALNVAGTQLQALETRLGEAQTALAPFDLLARPQTLEAVQALARLAQDAQNNPLLGYVVPEGVRRDAAALTATWETALRDRPPLPALADAQRAVRGWRGHVAFLQGRLTLTLVAFGVIATLLGAWVAAGQWALYRLADERLCRASRGPRASP